VPVGIQTYSKDFKSPYSTTVTVCPYGCEHKLENFINIGSAAFLKSSVSQDGNLFFFFYVQMREPTCDWTLFCMPYSNTLHFCKECSSK